MAPPRGGVGVEEGLQPTGDRVGDPEVDVGGAVAAAAHGQAGDASGPGLLGLEQLALLLLGDVGGDHLQHLPAQPAKPLGVEVSRLSHEVRLGLLEQVGVEVCGQVLQRPGDHPGLRLVYGSGGERLRSRCQRPSNAAASRPSASTGPMSLRV